jgi:uncharacterized membrane protein
MPVTQRYQRIDILRGIAIVLMVIYHFCYDLTYFKFLRLDFYHDPFWINFRILIVSLFVGLVGVSLVLATQNGINLRRYARRLGWLVLLSLVITVMSYFMFPGRTIVFGILHFIAFASVAGLVFVRLYIPSLVLGIGIIVLDQVYQHEFFDQYWIHWLGLTVHRPAAEDYVSVIPWFGVVLIGIFIGQTILRNETLQRKLSVSSDHPLPRSLAFAGRHSLLIYMLHQPILFAILWPVAVMAQ